MTIEQNLISKEISQSFFIPLKNKQQGVKHDMKNRERLIKFTKINLERLKWNGKQTFYFARDFEALCIAVNKFSKTYYAHWSDSIIGQNGKIKSIGRKKELGGFNMPLDEIKDALRSNLKSWKERSRSKGSTAETTVGDLVRSFIKNGLDGNRVRTRGIRLKYKDKTKAGYISSLKAAVLCEGVNSAAEYKELFATKIKWKDKFVVGALKDVPLSKVSRQHLDQFMHVMQQKPVAANAALAALSVAFEWDMTLAHTRLFQGIQNPCLRVVKYEVRNDKRHLDLDKVLEIRSYIDNNLHKNNSIYTPHFLAWNILLVENAERQADFVGFQWKKPNNIEAAISKGCTGWFNLDKGTFYLVDSKNRKEATEDLTDHTIAIFKKLHSMRYESLSWCLKSDWVFPRAEAPELPITENSYRWQRDRFFYKFGLATRELVRSKKTRKLYKYKCNYTFKHLRKTFATFYARSQGDVATQRRMRHSSLDVTQTHYITEDKTKRSNVDIFSPKDERQQTKLAAVKGGKND